METGAVKQAYNNELILLKKNLNQAKIQIIHKLTRKAKELTAKKVPDNLKEKFKRKAESAVKEVLIIKKIKPRDVGRFIVTHKGKLQDYLNRPQVDNDKACARLLLHKAMQEKYKFIKNRFADVPIKDLFMSRHERLKLKKEEQLKKKEKQMKKLKKGLVNAEGDWEVEDINGRGKQKVKDVSKTLNTVTEIENNEEDEENSDDLEHSDSNDKVRAKIREIQVIKGDKNDNSTDDQEMSAESDNDHTMLDDESISGDENNISGDENEDITDQEKISDKNDEYESGSDEDIVSRGFKISFKGHNNECESSQDSDEEASFGKFVKSTAKPEVKSKVLNNAKVVNKTQDKKDKLNIIKSPIIQKKAKSMISSDKNKAEKKDHNKNKNLNEKILNKKFKKELSNAPSLQKKVVDPFFITDSGENYLSIVEPRAPDEVKEEHRRGNRKIRRAAMFGRVPKIKPRQDFRQENNILGRQNGFGEKNNSKFDRPARTDKFQQDNKFSNRFINKFNDNGRQQRFNDKRNQEEKPEKLHPSWEAKKKQSGILPFQGKKIVFDDS